MQYLQGPGQSSISLNVGRRHVSAKALRSHAHRYARNTPPYVYIVIVVYAYKHIYCMTSRARVLLYFLPADMHPDVLMCTCTWCM